MRAAEALVWAMAMAAPGAAGAQTAANAALPSLDVLLAGGRTAMQAATGEGPALRVEDAERIALEENPEVHAAVRRVAAMESHVAGAGALDDAQLMVREWSVPLTEPWNLNQAQNMVMVGQALPGRGKRALRTAVAQSDVAAAKNELEMTRLKVRVEARRAFYDLLRAQDEIRIHDEHVGVARQAIEAARIKYTVGKVPQVEVLKAQLAMTRLAEHMIRFERVATVARARLNTLLARDPDRALRVEGEYGVAQTLPELEALVSSAMEKRPDLAEAEAGVEKSRREQALAKRTYAPEFGVTAGYMVMPPGSYARNNLMVEGSMSLPWLNRRKHDAELAEAAAATTEKDAELEAMRNTARGQIGEALAEAQSAQRLARVYQDSLRPQAEATLHAAVVAYENDQTSFLDLLDSQMTVVDADLAWIDALGEFNNRMADLEMAAGGEVSAIASAGGEEQR